MEKFYLDTNILFGYSLKKILERKGIYKESKVANFLISSSKKLKYAVSILTKAKIVRKLKSEFNANKKDIEDVWRGFIIEVSPYYIFRFLNHLKKFMRKLLILFSKFR
jgi:uncharacterized protein YbcC (UPF0753/DUF2309 family)